jgi:hypothetical protein
MKNLSVSKIIYAKKLKPAYVCPAISQHLCRHSREACPRENGEQEESRSIDSCI